MKETLTYIVTHLVDKPESVVIEEQQIEGITNYIISAAPEDIGKIIGKEGKVIRAIRNVMKILAIKQNVRINVSIADTDKPVEAAIA